MLREWIPHFEYKEKLKFKMLFHQQIQRSRVVALDKSISKFYLLNFDSLLPVIKPLYPDLGRPAKNQQDIISLLVLMLDQQDYSIIKWVQKVAYDLLVSTIINVPYAFLILMQDGVGIAIESNGSLKVYFSM